MRKSYKWGLALLGCALAVGWLLATPGLALEREDGQSDQAFQGGIGFALEGEDGRYNRDDHRGTGHALEGEDAWNVEYIGRSDRTDQRGIGKWGTWPTTEGRYAYAGCDAPDRCFNVWDLKKPENPKVITTITAFDIVNSPSPPPMDPKWTQTTPVPGWDPAWNTQTHFVARQGNILVVNLERTRAGSNYQNNLRGIRVYDVSNPLEPELLGQYNLPGTGTGTHHLAYDGRYAYLAAEYEGFLGRILVIVDLKHPRNPVEVGKWWVPGQANTTEELAIRNSTNLDPVTGKVIGWVPNNSFMSHIIWVETPANSGKWLPKKYVGAHWISIQGDRAYLSYHHAGLIILDIKHKSNPKFISRLDYHFPPKTPQEDPNPDTNWTASNTHAAKVIPGRHLVGITDEVQVCPYGWVRFVDISNERKPKIISEFKYSPENDWTPACPAGPPGYEPYSHMANAWGSNLLFVAWPSMGLRVLNISDPSHPKEVGHYVPPPIGNYTGLKSQAAGYVTENRNYVESCDVVFGPGGLLYVNDAKGAGVYVLKYTGRGGPSD